MHSRDNSGDCRVAALIFRIARITRVQMQIRIRKILRILPRERARCFIKQMEFCGIIVRSTCSRIEIAPVGDRIRAERREYIGNNVANKEATGWEWPEVKFSG